MRACLSLCGHRKTLLVQVASEITRPLDGFLMEACTVVSRMAVSSVRLNNVARSSAVLLCLSLVHSLVVSAL